MALIICVNTNDWKKELILLRWYLSRPVLWAFGVKIKISIIYLPFGNNIELPLQSKEFSFLIAIEKLASHWLQQSVK